MFGVEGKAVRLSRFIFIALALFAVAALAWPGQDARAGLRSIDGIRTSSGSGGMRIVIDLGAESGFRAFHMASPYRIVVDIEPAAWHAAKSGFTPGSLVRGYRSGTLDDGLVRIIFDLSQPAVIKNAFSLPKSSLAKDRIVVDLAASSANWFNARLPQVFGNRYLKGAGSAPVPASETGRRRNDDVRKAEVPSADSAVTGSAAPPLPKRKPSGRIYTVVIDAGHGGGDPGALGNGGIREKHITLSVARALERALAETGRYRAVMTRRSDTYVKLRDRVDMARRAKADLFVSIHADKIGRTNVRGASIYTLSQTASDKETARLAEQENNSGVVAGVDLAQESADVADILLDLAMREKMNESKLLARYLETAFRNKNVKLLPNSHRAAGFAVLKAPDVPSVLIETGFLSNPQEAKLLASSAFQQKIAEAIVDGIDAYFRKIRALQKI